MAHIVVKLDTFEGPFDLLFHLIEKNEMDIYDIPIASLTDQYMAYIGSFSNKDMDNMSEFLVMAATLLEIKSYMLLPKAAVDNQTEEDPREKLVEMLVEYKRFKEVTPLLKDKEEHARYMLFKQRENGVYELFKPVEKTDLNEILGELTMDGLQRVFQEILARRELTTDKIRSGFKQVKRDLFSVEQKMEYIQDLLSLKRKVYFSQMFKKNAGREEVIITFWAMLELNKLKKVTLSQKRNFSDIIVQAAEEC